VSASIALSLMVIWAIGGTWLIASAIRPRTDGR
jgi:hypothetical protein